MITPGPIDGTNVRIGYFTTADGTAIRNALWSPESKNPRGSVVLLGGRKEFLEKYTETAADLNQRGFAVFGFDWRGQGLSSRMLPDRLKGFVRNYDDYVQDLEEFFQRVVQPEAVRPIYLLAHSMGGHVALRYLHRQPADIDKAVLVAPMLDINTKPFPRWLVKGLVCSISKGRGETVASYGHISGRRCIGHGYYPIGRNIPNCIFCHIDIVKSNAPFSFVW